MRAVILVEVSTLGDIMRDLYEELVTVHKEIICLHDLQRQSREFVKILRNVQVSIDVMHDWTMRYKGEPLTLVKKMKSQKELEKARVRMLIQNNK